MGRRQVNVPTGIAKTCKCCGETKDSGLFRVGKAVCKNCRRYGLRAIPLVRESDNRSDRTIELSVYSSRECKTVSIPQNKTFGVATL